MKINELVNRIPEGEYHMTLLEIYATVDENGNAVLHSKYDLDGKAIEAEPTTGKAVDYTIKALDSQGVIITFSSPDGEGKYQAVDFAPTKVWVKRGGVVKQFIDPLFRSKIKTATTKAPKRKLKK